jgi:hypothetical protein
MKKIGTIDYNSAPAPEIAKSHGYHVTLKDTFPNPLLVIVFASSHSFRKQPETGSPKQFQLGVRSLDQILAGSR